MEAWFDPDNADYWGSQVALEPLRPAFNALSRRRILTVGDGKGAKEAVFFRSLGHHVTASDVATEVIEEAARRGLIEHWHRENAQNLSCEDGAFDFVVTKETLHHLPEPHLALSEMLRVASEGVVLIEPHYRHFSYYQMTPAMCVRRLLKHLKELFVPTRCRKHRLPFPSYEDSGNFSYRFNPYELTQVARAMGLPAGAIGYADTFYEPGCEGITGPELEDLKSRKQSEWARRDAREGIQSRPFLVYLFFKCEMTRDFLAALENQDFRLVNLDDRTDRTDR